MPKNNVTRNPFEDYLTENGFKALRTYCGNVRKGQPKIYTAPFAKGESIKDVLADWRKSLVSLEDKWPTLVEFEDDLAKKVGPLSVQKPLSERMEDIDHYYDDILLPSKPIDSAAIDAVINEFAGLRGLRLRSQKVTVGFMKKSSNSGTPYFTRRRNVIQDTLPANYHILSNMIKDMGKSMSKYRIREAAAIIGWRGQEGGPSDEDVKQRVVWMFPFGVNICELQVYQPLIEGCQKLNLVPAWVSMESVDNEITRLFDTKADEDLIICTDFSKFDQHFNGFMQSAAQEVLRNILMPGIDAYYWLNQIFDIKYNIPLILDCSGHNVRIRYGQHGMASGSGGTNADETITHRCLQHEVAMSKGEVLNPHSMCLGDDGIISYPGITVDDVVRAYESHGQECNKSKQYASTQDCVYLRRWHHNNYRINGVCVGVYSTCRAIGRLRYLERFMDPEYWSPELVALRQLSIIENCKWHPLFHEFIQFCMKRDKYRLGIDLPGFLDNITKLAEESIDHMQDFLGYTKTLQGDGVSGIAEWEVVKYLKSIR